MCIDIYIYKQQLYIHIPPPPFQRTFYPSDAVHVAAGLKGLGLTHVLPLPDPAVVVAVLFAVVFINYI